METVMPGKSIEGRPLDVYVGSGPRRRTAMVIGGFHGDEPKGVFIARKLIDVLEADAGAHADVCWVVMPLVNPDGYACRKRRNANRVDINRNFPTRNWAPGAKRSRMYGGAEPASEPETRAVMSAVRRFRPSWIITIHSIDGHRQCNNYDGPGEAIAAAMHEANRYPVAQSIGYDTPGSFGTWAGVERNIATITLELPSHHSAKRCWEDNCDAVLRSGRVLAV